MDPGELLQKTTGTLAGGLQQLRHLRYHCKDDIPAAVLPALDKLLERLVLLVEEVSGLDLRKEGK